MNLLLLWGALVIVFVVLEFLIVEFTGRVLSAIWFALGAAGALITATLVPTFVPQLIVFLVLSGVTLYFTRPLAKKYAKVKVTATNANRALEMVGVVRERVNKFEGTVHVNNKLWSARTVWGEPIEEGALVDVLRIEGVRLIVRPHAAKAAEETSQTPGK